MVLSLAYFESDIGNVLVLKDEPLGLQSADETFSVKTR